MRRYSPSRSSPSVSKSTCHEQLSGTICSGLSERVSRSWSIFRNSRYVSCSVYSIVPTPSSRSTLQYDHSLSTKRRACFAICCRCWHRIVRLGRYRARDGRRREETTRVMDARRLVDKLWSYCNVLRDDGVGTIEYTEQLTYLLFLKMAHERETRSLNPEQIVPESCSWQVLLDTDGDDLEGEYRRILGQLGRQPGTLGVIFRKAQNRIQDPAKLKRLIVDLIDKENWSATGTDIKGDAYEELLSKGAEDIKSGAGQYFTPRPLIQAMVDCVRPTAKDVVADPAAGTGGFLLAAHEHAAEDAETLTPKERTKLRDSFVHGVELVDGTARLAAMNLLLHA